MSAMGQTQALIGTMILLSSAAAILFSPWAVLVAAFFGTGLLMAGVTGRCPLASLICRMPWNRGDGVGCELKSR